MKISNKELKSIIAEELGNVIRRRRRVSEADAEEKMPAETDEQGSDDEVKSAQKQDMKTDVERVAKFMFKHPQLSKALTKIKGNVEAAQLIGLLSQELGVEAGDLSNVMGKVKKGMSDKEELQESPSGLARIFMRHQNDAKGAAMGLLTAGEDMAQGSSTDLASEYASYVIRQANIIVDAMVELEKSLPNLKEGRYHRTPYQGDDPRAQAFDQAIQLLGDQVYDSLEDDVASYVDDAVRALSKAIEELEYKRNQVGNVNEKRK